MGDRRVVDGSGRSRTGTIRLPHAVRRCRMEPSVVDRLARLADRGDRRDPRRPAGSRALHTERRDLSTAGGTRPTVARCVRAIGTAIRSQVERSFPRARLAIGPDWRVAARALASRAGLGQHDGRWIGVFDALDGVAPHRMPCDARRSVARALVRVVVGRTAASPMRASDRATSRATQTDDITQPTDRPSPFETGRARSRFTAWASSRGSSRHRKKLRPRS